MALNVVTPTEFDGVSVGPATPYDLVFALDGYGPLTSDLTLADRPDTTPRVEGQRQTARTVTMYIRQGTGIGATAQWQANVNRVFAPGVMTDRLLKGTHNSVTLQIAARITALGLMPGTDSVYVATLVFPDPDWQTTTLNTDSASPLTVGGTRPARPVLTVTPAGTTAAIRTVTVVDHTGRGVVNVLHRCTAFDSSGVGASATTNFDVFVQGARVPFYVSGQGTATTYLWVRVSLPANGSVPVTVIYGSSVNNTLTNQQLEFGGILPASSSNTSWVYDDLSKAATNPTVAGAWFLGRYQYSGAQVVTASTVYLYETENHAVGFLNAGADALMLVTGIEGAATGTLTGLTLTGLITGGYLLSRTAASPTWQMAASVTAGGSAAGPFNLPGAVAFAFWVPAPGAGSSSVVSQPGASFSVALDASKVPTSTVSAATTAYVLTGTTTNTTTGDTIAFDAYVTGAVTIDTSGPLVITATDPIIGSILPSNPLGFPLAVGSNGWVGPTGGSTSISWRDRYAL